MSRSRSRAHLDALLFANGSAHLFVTLNPADGLSPLCAALAGRTDDEIARMTQRERAVLAANDPVASALFFRFVAKAFLRYLVMPRRGPRKGEATDGILFDERGGVFGPVKSYYGTIESQGRGALHLHLLIWLRDCPSPDALFTRLAPKGEFHNRFFDFLDDIIRQDIPQQPPETAPDGGPTALELRHLRELWEVKLGDVETNLSRLRSAGGDIETVIASFDGSGAERVVSWAAGAYGVSAPV
jgi:hypothetical protein